MRENRERTGEKEKREKDKREMRERVLHPLYTPSNWFGSPTQA